LGLYHARLQDDFSFLQQMVWIYRKAESATYPMSKATRTFFPLGPLNHDARNKIKKKSNQDADI
jgi:hypothetical protein